MLYPLFFENRSEIIHKWVHYFPVYERHLKDFINKSTLLFEIGVFRGGSLKMWKKYLGPFTCVVGIDINPDCQKYTDKQCKIRIGDQADPAFLQTLIDEFGLPDIVIDDGSHMMRDVNASFDFLYPLLKNNGVYIVEDMHASYWSDFGGGLKKDGTFIEKAKDLVDKLNAWHVREQQLVDEFTKSTFSVCFYDSMVVFEKRIRQRPYDVYIGNDAL